VPSHFILYVADQQAARAFYQQVLACEPRLDVSGMTEFELPGGGVLGLMPEAGIRELLGGVIPERANADDEPAPRAELYLLLDEPQAALDRAIEAGAVLLQAIQPRDWGHEAGYCQDFDGHILAFALDPEAPVAGKVNWFRRLHNAVGPVAAGMVLDFWDLVTFGPLGWTVGPVIGLVVGWYLGGFYHLRIWSRLGLAALSAGYLAVPMTAFIPLGTLVSAIARILSKPPR